MMTLLSDKLFRVICTKADILKMLASGPNAVKNVCSPSGYAVLVAIQNRTAIMKQRDHFLAIIIDHESVSFSRRFKYVRPCLGHPVVFQIPP